MPTTYRYTLTIFFIFLIFFIRAEAQYDFNFHDFDSIKVFKYDGIVNIQPLLLPPPPPNSSRRHKRKYKKYLKENSRKTNIDTSWQISYRTDFSMDKKGKFNPSIKWELGIKLNNKQITEIDSILSGEKIRVEVIYNPNMCYNPRHTVFLFKQGKVIHNFDVCFECNRIKIDRKYLNSRVDYGYLKFLFEEIGILKPEKEKSP